MNFEKSIYFVNKSLKYFVETYNEKIIYLKILTLIL